MDLSTIVNIVNQITGEGVMANTTVFSLLTNVINLSIGC